MKKQMLMSVSSSGGLFGLVVSRNMLLGWSLFLGVLSGFGIWGVGAFYQSEALVAMLNQSNRELQQLREQRDHRLLALTAQLQTEREKLAVYARTLGQMQARMARLDALGARLVDVAALDKSEFDFGVAPAFGGLRQGASASADIDAGLGGGVDAMDARLKQLDAQLAAVDFMLGRKQTADHSRPYAWPTKGGWISSGFGPRIDPFSGAPARHRGVDIANHFGAPVLAASRGVVTFAGKMDDFGYVVDVDHGHGYRTRYAHMSALAVSVGDVVVSRQQLGRIGSTGHSTGPHLHYEVRHNGRLINPKPFLHRG